MMPLYLMLSSASTGNNGARSNALCVMESSVWVERAGPAQLATKKSNPLLALS